MFTVSILPERCCMLFERGRLLHDVIASNICSDVKKKRREVNESNTVVLEGVSGIVGGMHR